MQNSSSRTCSFSSILCFASDSNSLYPFESPICFVESVQVYFHRRARKRRVLELFLLSEGESFERSTPFAVIGGKLSEGIIFSDDLGRCIAIVGMPYPNKTDVVLQEKMNYLNQQESGSGQIYYTNLCMKAVNQAIGRAFRHKEDWACVVFFDCRYGAHETRQRLTRWIDSRGTVCDSTESFIKQLELFYHQFIYCV